MMRKISLFGCVALCVAAFAIAVFASPYRSDTIRGEGETLDIIEVPEGSGDGRITERDAIALSEYCVWGFNEVLSIEGYDVVLGRDAEDRMLDFWVYVWDVVPWEMKAYISVFDELWPQVREEYEAEDDEGKMAIIEGFALLIPEIWGGYELETVSYLAGELSPEEYACLLDTVMAQSGSGGGYWSDKSSGEVLDILFPGTM